MALKINGTALKKCNVNGTVCKHIDVNGVNVWNAEYVFFPNADTLNPSNWAKSSNGYGSSWLDVTNKIIRFGAKGGSDNSHFKCSIAIDMTPYKTCYVNVTALSNPGAKMVTLMWRDTSSGYSQISMSPLTTGVSQWDVSNVNTVVSLDISGDYGNYLDISEIIFEE